MFLSQTMNIRESQTGEARKKHQSKGDRNKENKNAMRCKAAVLQLFAITAKQQGKAG